MQKLVLEEGGRPVTNDDLDLLQNELNAAATAVLQDMQPHVVAGCQVYSRGAGLYDVAYGLVWMAGQLLRFGGASGVTMPAEIVLGEVVVNDERTYETGGTKPCIVEQTTLLLQAATAETAVKISFNAQGGVLRHEKVRESKWRTVGEIQFLALLESAEYDEAGKGRLGTQAYGWALTGSVGTAQAQGRFPVVINPDNPKFAAIGAVGGTEEESLTVAQLPAHSFKMATLATDNKGSTGNGAAYAKSDSGNNGKDTNRATESLGQNQAHNNLPPFYGFAARQWIGF